MIINVEDDFNIRIDKWISDHAENLSRSYIQNLIENHNILVDSKPVKSNYKVSEYDEISIILPDSIEPEIKAENIPLDIVYEDDDIIIINKPKGMVVHPAPGHYTGTLVNALMYHCKDNLSGINGVMRPGIVHRIDKDTTGLVVACKNDKAHLALSEQLKVHSITRKYRAIVNGVIKDDSGTVEGSIARHPADRKKMTIDNFRGRPAITHYRVIKRFKNHTYVECQLETGRTHQIRVHMKHIGHPVLGDTVYGPEKCAYKLEGQALHAMVLGFIHPSTKEYVEFISDPEVPGYFSDLLHKLPG
ncbi:MAG: RluA family pseudouridine synthase [Lachnospiraceae bacterium]|nr:RluA family pseudouridine synthase [Lachnospiraceae bacterium]